MKEFTAKKLGEVMAFANVGKEILERGRVALEPVFSTRGVNQLLHDMSQHQVRLNDLVLELGVGSVSQERCEKTSVKLRKMIELYIGEEWDNPTELLEGLSFIEGAALTHWKLVAGAAEALDHNEIKKMSETAISFHQKLLRDIGILTQKMGVQKA
jgi:hypothetical protein